MYLWFDISMYSLNDRNVISSIERSLLSISNIVGRNIIDIIILLFILTRLVIPIFELISSFMLRPIKNTIIIDIALLVRLRI